MKKIILTAILCSILSIGAYAKPATSMWYIMFLCNDSQCYDDNIEIIYKGRSGFANPVTMRGLVPKMLITIKNKTDKMIYIDLSNCFFKKNDCVTPFVAKQKIVSIPPKSNLEEEVVLFRHGDEVSLGNLIYFTDSNAAMSGSAKFDYIFAPQRDDLMVGEVKQYKEDNTILNILASISYSFDASFTEISTVTSKYYAQYLFGTKYVLSPFSQKERDIVVSTWTQYNLPESPTSFEIRIWAPK